jgi:putative addiction module CopG family antidote
MNIVLTPRHERFISRKVKSGAYGSAEEVIQDGLRRLEADDERKQRLAWLREEVAKGFNGPATPWTKNDAERVRQLVTKRAKGDRDPGRQESRLRDGLRWSGTLHL